MWFEYVYVCVCILSGLHVGELFFSEIVCVLWLSLRTNILECQECQECREPGV